MPKSRVLHVVVGVCVVAQLVVQAATAIQYVDARERGRMHDYESVVFVNTNISIAGADKCNLNISNLCFAPLGMTVPVDGKLDFTTTVPGEYCCCADESKLNSDVTIGACWRAIEMPDKMGQSTPIRFNDTFVSPRKTNNDTKMTSDIAFDGWIINDNSCVKVVSPVKVYFESTDCSGITTAEHVPSMFAESVTLRVGAHFIGAQTGQVFNLTYGQLSVSLTAMIDSIHAEALEEATSRVITQQTIRKCSETEIMYVILNANAVNISFSVICGTKTHTLWNGSGVKHNVHCEDHQSADYDCGSSIIKLSGGAIRLDSVVLSSNLVPGNDPIRPSVTVPVYSAVLAGLTDEIGFKSPDLGVLQSRANDGIIDVTQPPFSADPNGQVDATVAIQAAVDYAREHYSIVYFPPGNYVVSDTIVIRAIPRAMAAGHIPGPKATGGWTDDFLLDGVSSRYVPNYLCGSRQRMGTTITLKSGSPGFTNASAPKYVLDFFFENSAGISEPNAQYNTVAMNLKIVVADNTATVPEAPQNVGAVGVRLRGAQGSGLEDITVIAGVGLTGVVGGCGSGGASHGVLVVGGRYGMDLRQSQPTATISGITLEGQRCAAIVYGGFESLSAVGVNITDQKGYVGVISTDVVDATFQIDGDSSGSCDLPFMPTSGILPDDYQKTNPGILGKMSFVDSTVEFSTSESLCSLRKDCTAFSVIRTFAMENVYMSNVDVAVVTRNTTSANVLPGLHCDAKSDCQVLHVKKFVFGIDPPAYPANSFQLHAPIYIDGVRTSKQVISDVEHLKDMSFIPTNLISKHKWSSNLKSFEFDECINVKNPDDPDWSVLPAKGDGFSDDYEAIQFALDHYECIFLPRGLYLTSRTIQVPQGKSMVGVARHLTRLTSMHDGLSGAPRHFNPWRPSNWKPSMLAPVVETLPSDAQSNSPQQETFVGFLSISVWNSLNTTSALHWHATNGTYRQLHANRANRCGSLYRPGCENSVQINYPLQTVQGVESLKMYTYYLEDCCQQRVNQIDKTRPFNQPYWSGFLAGPQGPLYRHLKVDSSSNIGFYHLNCEHGTGEAICEFNNSQYLSVYGLKTEGRFVTLWVRDCDQISIFGTGGAGCSANDTIYPSGYTTDYPPTLYRVERTPNFQFINLIDQHSMLPITKYPNISDRPRNMFDEFGCPPSITHMLYVQQESTKSQTMAFDRPAYFSYGQPNP